MTYHMIKSHDIPCDLVTWHYHMTWSHDLPHDLVTWFTTWPGHMIYHITWSIYNHMMHLLFVISRTTSKMIDVYGINTCVWYLCYFFHAFFCCFFACSINVCSSTAQAAFKCSSVPKQELLLLLFFMGSYLPCATVAHINKLMTMLHLEITHRKLTTLYRMMRTITNE